jgi:hypothetical protein
MTPSDTGQIRRYYDRNTRSFVAHGQGGDLPADLDVADVAYAIESFVHAPDPGRFSPRPRGSCGREARS